MLFRISFASLALSVATAWAWQRPFQMPVPTEQDNVQILSHPSLPAYSVRLHRVPDGVCERAPTASWSGYLDVLFEKEREAGHASALATPPGIVEHFYFWAFESRTDPRNDPLTLWLNGGPGCSSFTGRLMELGPGHAAPRADDQVPRTEWNPYSWTTNSSMIFLDQPIGVGFSYASWKNGSTNNVPPARIFSTEQSARDVSAFLHLLAASPHGPFEPQVGEDGSLQMREFHMAGESYAGRYLPLIASRIVNDNEHYMQHPEDGLEPLPLRSILIGNGITSPRHQNAAYVEYACTKKSGHGPFLDDKTCKKMWKKLPVCEEKLAKCNKHRGPGKYDVKACQDALSFCEEHLSTPWEKTNSSFYDWNHPVEYKQSAYVHDFLNHADTRRDLGLDHFRIGDQRTGEFKDCSDNVYNNFASTGDGARDSTWAIEHILEKGIRVLSYSGRRDFICNFIGNGNWVHDLEWSGSKGYREAPLEDWFIHGQKARAGQFRSYGNMTYAIVEEAGHFVPLDQPPAALAMFERWVHPRTKLGRLD